MSQPNYGEALKKINKKANKKEKWIRTRMWFSTFISLLYNDRGTIPANIGNNVLVTNNMYITKNGLNAFIIVKEYSDFTPEAFTSDMLAEVKDQVNNVIIDTVFKNTRYYPDISSSGLKRREEVWRNTLDNPNSTEYYARRAARCLYTVDVIKSGEPVYKVKTYITIRSNNGKDLSNAIQKTCNYLNDIGASFYVVKSNTISHMKYASMISDKLESRIKDVPYAIMSQENLAESIPSVQGSNDTDGTFMGIDKRSNDGYFINFRLSANAKNIYICSRSGFGKTFLAANWGIDMYADLYNMCIQDIKGTEFVEFTKACGGRVISMRPDSTEYLNTFVWNEKEIRNISPLAYANKMLRLSTEQMMLISELGPDKYSRGQSLLQEFLTYVYTDIGATVDNKNTWSRTNKLNPFVVYDYFKNYLSTEIMQKYNDVAGLMLDRLRIFWSNSGTYRHMFLQPYSYSDIYDSRVITYDFGILENAAKPDPIVFKLKVFYMEVINDEYVSYKKNNKEWTVKILEESQIVEDYMLDIYAREITLSRARNQINILIGNSVSALQKNPKASSILENINILVLGILTKSSREYFVNEFGLTEDDEDTLKTIASDPDMENTFLMINKLQKDVIKPLLHVYVPDRVRDGKLFKGVDTVEAEE